MRKISVLMIGITFLMYGCNTIKAPFVGLAPDLSTLPVDEMRSLAAEVESTVKSGNRDAVLEDRGGLVVSSEEVRHAIRTRCARSELISEMLNEGFIFEEDNGLVAIIRNGEYKARTTSKERDRHAMIVMGENGNRWTLYEGIMKDSKLETRSLSAIQSIFHEERVKMMTSGQQYVDAEGNRIAR